MNYLLSGSLAYDTILLHNGQFNTRILPEALSRLNVSFGVNESKTEFGGTAGNIAYNSSLLGDNLLLCSSVGNDFKRYEDHLVSNKISIQYLTTHSMEPTAQIWILTDQNNNQISAFQSGAMKKEQMIPSEAYKLKLWHIAPESSTTMAMLAKKATENKINYFLDPGQGLPSLLEGDAEHVFPFLKMVESARGIFINEYESFLLQEKTKKTLRQLLTLNNNMLFIVETLGSKGLKLHTKAIDINIPVAQTNKVVDPTGCGDAFRAGFNYGYTRNLGLKSCSELGSVMGSFAIESSGGQNHKVSLKEISHRLKLSYGWSLL